MLFNKEADQPSKEEIELQKLTDESAELSKTLSMLSAEALAEQLQRRKEEILEKKGKIFAKKMHVDCERDKIKNKIAIVKTEELIKEKIDDVYVYVNEKRINSCQELEIPFSCGHKLTIPLRQLFSYATTQEGNTHYDLAQWNSVLANCETRTRHLLCPDCIKEKRNYTQKTHTQSTKKTGIAILKLMVMP